ncbi:13160_t:CDS:2 [Entrophospora sp. SA101]|nr:13160_t:CDS:2 [Entrophospora sp. SA101]
MPQELQIKATILDIEPKFDKNNNPYFRLSLAGMPTRYFYAFSFNADTLYSLVADLKETLQLLEDQKGQQLDD